MVGNIPRSDVAPNTAAPSTYVQHLARVIHGHVGTPYVDGTDDCSGSSHQVIQASFDSAGGISRKYYNAATGDSGRMPRNFGDLNGYLTDAQIRSENGLPDAFVVNYGYKYHMAVVFKENGRFWVGEAGGGTAHHTPYHIKTLTEWAAYRHNRTLVGAPILPQGTPVNPVPEPDNRPEMRQANATPQRGGLDTFIGTQRAPSAFQQVSFQQARYAQPVAAQAQTSSVQIGKVFYNEQRHQNLYVTADGVVKGYYPSGNSGTWVDLYRTAVPTQPAPALQLASHATSARANPYADQLIRSYPTQGVMPQARPVVYSAQGRNAEDLNRMELARVQGAPMLGGSANTLVASNGRAVNPGFVRAGPVYYQSAPAQPRAI